MDGIGIERKGEIMYLIVNEIELTVNNAYTERDADTNTLSAIIEVPYEAMDFTALKVLFMEHSGIITKVLDDGSTESWDGFKYDKPPVDDGEQYKIVLIGNEESYQIERLRHMEVVLAEKETTINSKDMVISNLNGTISEKDKTIAEREEIIIAKDTVIGEKEVVITEQKETITTLEATIISKDEELTAKDAEIAELLTIAEEYADMVFASLEENEIEFPEAEIEDLESEVM